MTTPATTDAVSYCFDDRNFVWHRLGEFEHLVFAMLDVDEERKIFDALVKYEPDRQIFLHRHLAHTNTLVIQGEHRLYEPDGSLREVRPMIAPIAKEAAPKAQWSITAFVPSARRCSKSSTMT